MEEVKHISKSKTLWYNLIMAALAVLIDNTGLLRAYLPDGSYLALMMLSSMGNVYLRTITTTAVRLT